MSYYLEDDGTHTKKGKGPNKKAWKQNPNNKEEWIKDSEYISSSKSISTAMKRDLHYIRFDSSSGEFVSHKLVGRGRRPLSYVKFELVDNIFELIDGEILPENADLSSIPVDLGKAVSEKNIKTSKIKEISVCENKMTYEDFEKCVKSGSKYTKNGIRHYVNCDIIGNCSIDFLIQNPIVSHIEIELSSGDISVWKLVYESNDPEAVIRGAVETCQVPV